MIDAMQVYIANLGKYNEGELVGDWFSFPLDEEVIAERIGLNAEYEEYAIHDTDNFPMEISEYTSIEELVEHKDDIILYSGCETMTDVAYYLIDEVQALGEIPSHLQNYIDYEAYGRDLDIEGIFIATNAGICEVLRLRAGRSAPPLVLLSAFLLGGSLGNPAVPVVMKMKKGAFTSEENPKLYKYLERGKSTVCHQ